MSELKKHGVLYTMPDNEPLDQNVAELTVNGYTVVQSGLSAQQIEDFKASLERVYAEQVNEMGGEAELAKMNDKDIVRALLAYDQSFVGAIWTKPLQDFCKKVFKHGHVLVSQNGLLNRPDANFYQTYWHRDFNWQHFTSSKPLGITAILCLNDFTADNGATFVLPASHHVVDFPTEQFVQKYEKQIVAPAGSYVVINSMLYHRAGLNRSNDIRRGIAHVIGEPLVAQSVNLPAMLTSKGVPVPADEELASFLGYRWTPAMDVVQWRKSRIK